MEIGHSGVRTINFLDLPPEIRNNIYDKIRQDLDEQNDDENSGAQSNSRKDFPHQLTRVSRQLRRETLSLFTKNMVFRFGTNKDVGTLFMETWLQAACDDTVAAVRKVEIWRLGEEMPLLSVDLDDREDVLVFSLGNPSRRAKEALRSTGPAEGGVGLSKWQLESVFQMVNRG